MSAEASRSFGETLLPSSNIQHVQTATAPLDNKR